MSGRRVGKPGEVGVDSDQRRLEVRVDERRHPGDGVDQALSGARGPAFRSVRAQPV
ncbi:Exonuclease SbcD [Burkholderia cenocepacia]|nr:Exonuclease SbcD [Burkholderia cenocepacia]